MTWPTTPIATTNLDQGLDNPALARADIKQMADAVNGILGAITPVDANNSVATDDLLQYNGTAWVNQDLMMKAYQERITSLGTVASGTVNIDFDATPVQTLTLTGNVTFAFVNGNTETAKSVTLWLQHSGAGRSITFPGGTRFAYGDNSLSTSAGTIDMIHMQSVYLFGTPYKMVSIIKGFA
jgi:hypothetical protein